MEEKKRFALHAVVNYRNPREPELNRELPGSSAARMARHDRGRRREIGIVSKDVKQLSSPSLASRVGRRSRPLPLPAIIQRESLSRWGRHQERGK